MPDNSDTEGVEETAFEENLEVIIYHLDVESFAFEMLDLVDDTGLASECTMCGTHAVWYTSEIHTEEGFESNTGRVTRCWCHSCMPQPMIELWKSWPWTSVDALETFNRLDPSTDTDDKAGLADQENVPSVIRHLDLEAESTHVTGILDHYGIDREKATCADCENQATWYYGKLLDVFRAYDFGAARENKLLCEDCISSAGIRQWDHWPWTPDKESDHPSSTTDD